MITSDKGRLSEDEIARMVSEAQEHAEEDARRRRDVEARNQLEGYLFAVRGTLGGEAGNKISEEDRSRVREVLDDAFSWLEGGRELGQEDYDEKRREVEGIVGPIVAQGYSQAGATGEDVNSDNVDEGTSHARTDI